MNVEGSGVCEFQLQKCIDTELNIKLVGSLSLLTTLIKLGISWVFTFSVLKTVPHHLHNFSRRNVLKITQMRREFLLFESPYQMLAPR